MPHAQIGVFHLFGQSALLAFQNVAQKIQQLVFVAEGEGPRDEVREESVSEGYFGGGPTSRSGDGGVVFPGGVVYGSFSGG